jgi:DNA-binding MarR family transcriptional regulator
MNLELSELESFIVLARSLHFRKASEQLFLSQPALSRKIRRLEEKIHGPLFVRTRRKVALTEAGRILLPKARRLLEDVGSTLAATQAAVEGKAGTLRIGFGIASVAEILPRTILRFRKNYPDVQLEMQDMSSPSQVSTWGKEAGLELEDVKTLLRHENIATTSNVYGDIGMEAKRRIQKRLVRFVKEQAESRETPRLVLKGTPASLQ